MRQITRESVEAFLYGHSFNKANMQVWTDNYGSSTLKLHGNTIARSIRGEVCVTFAGWQTPTTKERLNGLAELMDGTRPFYQKAGQLYFNDRAIESNEWVEL